MSYALRLLGCKYYSFQQMQKKLKEHIVVVQKREGESLLFSSVEDEDIVKSVLLRLQELGYLNDYELVDAYLRYRSKVSPRGLRLLHQELRKKWISREIIDQVIKKSEIDELELALGSAKRKQRQLVRFPKDKQRQKLILFLRSRGFSPQTIHEVFEAL